MLIKDIEKELERRIRDLVARETAAEVADLASHLKFQRRTLQSLAAWIDAEVEKEAEGGS